MSNPPTDEAAAALRIHNDARAGQNLEALVWDDDLAKQATEYAQYLADANIGLEHSSGPHDPDQGESLYMEMGQSDPVSAAAQAWINEVENYHGEAIGEGDFGSYGHYSKPFTLLFFSPRTRQRRVRANGEDSSSVHVVEHDKSRYGVCDGGEWLGLRCGEIQSSGELDWVEALLGNTKNLL